MNIRIKEAFAIGLPYFIAVGACYLFGYWGAFNINALEFISFADVAKLAVYPLLASLLFAIVGYLTGYLISAPHFPLGGGGTTRVGVFGRTHWRALILLLLMTIVLVATRAPEPGSWFIVSVLVAILSVPLTHAERLIEILPDARARSTILWLLLFLPSVSFALGRSHAFFVKAGTSGQTVDVARSKLPLDSDPRNPVEYLGFLGSVYVLREAKTGVIVFVKQRDDSPLFLEPRTP